MLQRYTYPPGVERPDSPNLDFGNIISPGNVVAEGSQTSSRDCGGGLGSFKDQGVSEYA
ncbi:MAG: hypothetical protein KAR44_09260 [Candidatus Aegiribacteria sp.]|nr:hypothetical protein [Candidatus Aegiribacteria sp.]